MTLSSTHLRWPAWGAWGRQRKIGLLASSLRKLLAEGISSDQLAGTLTRSQKQTLRTSCARSDGPREKCLSVRGLPTSLVLVVLAATSCRRQRQIRGANTGRSHNPREDRDRGQARPGKAPVLRDFYPEHRGRARGDCGGNVRLADRYLEWSDRQRRLRTREPGRRSEPRAAHLLRSISEVHTLGRKDRQASPTRGCVYRLRTSGLWDMRCQAR